MIRIVKLTFDPAQTAAFELLFAVRHADIRHFPGCTHLELWKDKTHTGVYFTYSHWENMEALDAYRHSELFKGIWTGIKVWFSGKPEAWSVENIPLITP